MKICAYGPIKNGLRSLPISECEKATSHPPTPDDKMEGQPARALSHKERDDNYLPSSPCSHRAGAWSSAKMALNLSCSAISQKPRIAAHGGQIRFTHRVTA